MHARHALRDDVAESRCGDPVYPREVIHGAERPLLPQRQYLLCPGRADMDDLLEFFGVRTVDVNARCWLRLFVLFRLRSSVDR